MTTAEVLREIAVQKQRLAPLVSADVKAAVARVAVRFESDLRRLADG